MTHRLLKVSNFDKLPKNLPGWSGRLAHSAWRLAGHIVSNAAFSKRLAPVCVLFGGPPKRAGEPPNATSISSFSLSLTHSPRA
jgi:hypothetical protein